MCARKTIDVREVTAAHPMSSSKGAMPGVRSVGAEGLHEVAPDPDFARNRMIYSTYLSPPRSTSCDWCSTATKWRFGRSSLFRCDHKSLTSLINEEYSHGLSSTAKSYLPGARGRSDSNPDPLPLRGCPPW